MKFISKQPVIFTPAARTLDFSGWAAAGVPFDVRGLMAVVDVTANTQIHAVGVTGLGISAINAAGTLVTLQFNTTSGFGANDILAVWYDDAIGYGTDATGVTPLSGGLGEQGYLSSLFALMAGRPTAGVDYPAAKVRSVPIEDLLQQILREQRIMNVLIAQGLQLNDTDIDGMRADPQFNDFAN
jgi:hypothetical protein